MIRTRVCLVLFAAGGLLLIGLLVAGMRPAPGQETAWQHQRDLVSRLGLTDLSLSSEARYTRHISQADLFSAFQDFPAAFEHFPSGSVILPRPVGYSGRVRVLPAVQKDP